jgi:hypothetical protein
VLPVGVELDHVREAPARFVGWCSTSTQSSSSSIASSTAHVAASLPSFTTKQGSRNSASEPITPRIVDPC